MSKLPNNGTFYNSRSKLLVLSTSCLSPVERLQHPPVSVGRSETAYSTWYFKSFPHRSANQARPCLASKIRKKNCPYSGW